MAVALVLSACVSRNVGPDAPAPGGARGRTVSITGALIGLGKADGTQWDGMGAAVNHEAAVALAAALKVAQQPHLAVAAVLAGAAAGAMEKPDISGHVELWVGGRLARRIDLDKQDDTFTPQWSSVAWERVDIDNARIRVVLQDVDLRRDDNVGIAEIGAGELRAAATAGHVHAVRVDGQTSGQLLFINVSVM